MNNRHNLSLISFLFGFLILVSTACLPDNEPDERAFISLRAEFTDSGTMTPIEGTRIDIFAEYSTASNPIHRGWENTDEDGVIEGFLDSLSEINLTKIIFVTVIDEEEYIIEEDVDVAFRFEEPYEEIDLDIEIPVTEVEEEKEEEQR